MLPLSRMQLILANPFAKQYWYRPWIRQEILLARNVVLHCGDETISWPVFARGYSRRSSNPTLDDAFEGEIKSRFGELENGQTPQTHIIDNLVQQRQLGAGGMRSDSLRTLLRKYRYAHCKYPNDRVYEPLPLASDCEDSATYKVDYGLHVADVIFQVIDFYKTLDAFECGTLGEQLMTALLERSSSTVFLSRFVRGVLQLRGYLTEACDQ